MRILHRQCFWLACLSFLAFGSGSQAHQPTIRDHENIVEVDLIFPRNDTYAPAQLIPIVFAIQNTKAAKSATGIIRWNIYDLEAEKLTGKLTGVDQDDAYFNTLNISDSDPYFTRQATSKIFNRTGTWLLKWEFLTSNCTKSAFNGQTVQNLVSIDKRIVFTTKTGSPQPNIASDSSTQRNDTCDSTQGVAVKILTTLPTDGSADFLDTNTCSVLDGEFRNGNPCGVHIDAATAANISSSITARACASNSIPAESCPRKHDSAAQRLAYMNWGMPLAGMFSWLAYCLI